MYTYTYMYMYMYMYIYNNFIVLSLTKIIKTNGLQQKGTKSPYKVVPVHRVHNLMCLPKHPEQLD